MRRIYVLSLLLSSSLAMAEAELSMDRLFAMSLQELLDTKVTSATRHEESLDSVPASVTVFTRQQIRILGINRLSSLMNFVPGFQSQRSDNSSIAQRFSNRAYAGAASGREILILLDGQRLNTDWNGGLDIANGLISLNKVARVEFIRGPGSAIYGSNAYLGVINLISQASNEAQFSMGTLNGTGTHAQASLRWQTELQHWQTQVFVNVKDNEGQSLQIYDPLKNASVDSRDPYFFKEVYLKANNENLSLAFYHSATRSEQFYVGGFVANDINLMDARSRHVNLNYQYELSPQWTLNSKLSLAQKRFDVAVLISPAAPPNELGITGEIEEQEPQAELTFSFKGDDGSNALLGIEWRRPKIIDSDANLFGIVDTYLPQAPLTHRTIYGLFAQYQADISAQLHYVVGLRHDDYSNFGSHDSPRGGLIWQYADGKTLKWLYGESFRAPSRAETDIENSSAIVANPNLKPEVARTTELIWQTREQQNYLATTLFYTELDNVISNAQTTPVERYNTGNETLAGIELEWHHQWSPTLSSRVNTSWIFDGPSQVNSEAEFFSGASLVYVNNKYSVALLASHHADKQDAYVENQIDMIREISARSFLDVHIVRFLPHDMDTYIHLSNLTDENYQSVSEKADNNTGVPNRGVGISTGLRWQF